MSLSPLVIRKTRFRRRLRGYDPQEVEEFLEVVGDELTRALSEVERLRQQGAHLQDRVRLGKDRERELQETMVRAQKVSEEMMANAQREAQLLVKEAEVTGDRIVQQAIDRSQAVERSIADLRQRRQELRLKLESTLQIFQASLDADIAGEEASPATVHSLPRRRQEPAG
jgi:cell division initiation protein